MNINKQNIKEYLSNVRLANTELAKKELLKDLLAHLFGDEPEANAIIKKMSLGAEKAVINIPHKTHVKRGRADTQYGTVIIEFENNLKRTGQHAKEQLKEYLLGNWITNREYNFTLIATDCLTWKVYAPSYEEFRERVGTELKEVDSFELSENNLEKYYYFLDRYLFRYNKQQATLDNIKVDFGEGAAVFWNVIFALQTQYKKAAKDEAVKLKYDEWFKFLSLAYGSFKGSPEVFMVHTYLSVFSKILAYTVITQDDFIDDEELKAIIKGDIFERHNVINFIDNDFYSWVASDDNLDALIPAFRTIAQKISNYDFKVVGEDVLKGIYQELIDIDTKHALGEYYTPDWLCEKIVEELPIKDDSRILDPACGSGSFLRAVVDRIKAQSPHITADQLANRVVGIDIHPLSVQIAKTTLLLAMGTKIKNAKHPVTLNVFLSNTLLIPQAEIRITGHEYKMEIDNKHYYIDMEIFKDAGLFDKAIQVCDKLAELSYKKQNESIKTLEKSIYHELPKAVMNETALASFYEIYKAIKTARDEGRDTIWKFMLQNLYKPFFLKDSFDLVVGNPPWLTYSQVKNAGYQNMLSELAKKYNLLPKTADMPHLEIAAIFLSHASSYFLKTDGKMCFVLPRSFISASHHNNTRNGIAKGFELKEIWDLKGVSPLFKVPACVLKADRVKTPPGQHKGALPGYIVTGKLKKADSSLAEASGHLEFNKAEWYTVKLGGQTAFSTDKGAGKHGNKLNDYKMRFKQGATIVPRNFYFIELTQDEPKTWTGRKITVMSSKVAREDAKKPWKDIEPLKGTIDSKYLFRTALSKNVVPFGLIKPPLVVLPIRIGSEKHISLLTWDDLKKEGHLETSEWFQQVEKLWNKFKTERSQSMTYIKRLDFQRGIVEQELNKKYIVIYTASSKDANAVVVKQEEQDLEFIVESKTYWYATNNLNEAYYVAAFLNSNYANNAIKAFQTTGLFGPRDIHKRILDIPLPYYDKDVETHFELAKLGKECSQKTESILQKTKKDYNVGTLRREVRGALERELVEVDRILGNII